MPLPQGYSRKAVGKSIKMLKAEGRPHGQAIAIALSHARRQAKKRGVRPHHLFGTRSARRYLRGQKRRAGHSRER
jgi:uncharacterized protein YoaH (UPF0181 family)